MDEQVYTILAELLEGLTSSEKVTQDQLLDLIASLRTLLKVYSEVNGQGQARKPGFLEKFKV